MLEAVILILDFPLREGKKFLVVVDALALNLRLGCRHRKCLILCKEIKP